MNWADGTSVFAFFAAIFRDGILSNVLHDPTKDKYFLDSSQGLVPNQHEICPIDIEEHEWEWSVCELTMQEMRQHSGKVEL